MTRFQVSDIGRQFVAHTPPEKREEMIFEIVSQFNRGSALITSATEREQVADESRQIWRRSGRRFCDIGPSRCHQDH